MPIKSSEPFFDFVDDWFIGNGGARGPWNMDACHGGPVSAALARATELAITDKQLVRLTANFVRPVPMSGFRIDTEIIRDGRTAASTYALLRDRNERVCATATSTHIVSVDVGEVPTHDIDPPTRQDCTGDIFCFSEAPHGEPFFSQYVDMEFPPGEDNRPGPTTVWLKTPPLLGREVTSPFQRICPLADCGNATSRHQEIHEMSFVNPDITINLHRLPTSEWMASSSVSHWQDNGVGLSHAILFDEQGAVGVALQSLLLRPLHD